MYFVDFEEFDASETDGLSSGCLRVSREGDCPGKDEFVAGANVGDAAGADGRTLVLKGFPVLLQNQKEA